MKRNTACLTAVVLLAACASASCGEAALSLAKHSASIGVQVNSGLVHVNASGDSDVPSLAAAFCAKQGIDHPRCSHFVSVDLWDALWCQPGQKAKAAALLVQQLDEGGAVGGMAAASSTQQHQHKQQLDEILRALIPRVYRFLHHENFADSDEFSLLRPRLQHHGFVECAAGLSVSGEEDAVWLLGHLSEQPQGSMWPYSELMKKKPSTTTVPSTSSSSSSFSFSATAAVVFSVNAFPNSGHLGNKDDMLLNLLELGKQHSGDAATNFLPRTWSPDHLTNEAQVAAAAAAAAAAVKADKVDKQAVDKAVDKASKGKAAGDKDDDDDTLVGLWFQKDPQKELGSGISVVESVKPLQLARQCQNCVLQRYVDDPFLLDGKKFSIGVYTAFTGAEPLGVWLHREMLVLVCTHNFERTNASSTLSHLSNGLLNRRLNPNDESECEGCAYNATEQVWTTDRFLAHLRKRNISWLPIERQIRRIILTTFTAAHEKFVGDVRSRVPGCGQEGSQQEDMRQNLFSHWRFDFLLDNSGGGRGGGGGSSSRPKAWLLETEIVPSTGTIGGVDEVIKQVVLRDILTLVGWGAQSSSSSSSSSPSLSETAVAEKRGRQHSGGDNFESDDDDLDLDDDDDDDDVYYYGDNGGYRFEDDGDDGSPLKHSRSQQSSSFSSSSSPIEKLFASPPQALHPTLDVDLCASLPFGGWGRKLCDEKLLLKGDRAAKRKAASAAVFSTPSQALPLPSPKEEAETGQEEKATQQHQHQYGGFDSGSGGACVGAGSSSFVHLRRWVVRVLRSAGDSLWLDPSSVDLVVRHESMRRRAQGYQLLSPVASAVLLENLPATTDGGRGGGGGGGGGVELGYVAFDGTPFLSAKRSHSSTGSATDGNTRPKGDDGDDGDDGDASGDSGAQDLAAAERLFLSSKAMPKDLVLWRFEAAKAKLRLIKKTKAAAANANADKAAAKASHSSSKKTSGARHKKMSGGNAFRECRRCLSRPHPTTATTAAAGADGDANNTLKTSDDSFFYYCASVAGVTINQHNNKRNDGDSRGEGDELVFQGECLAPWQTCRDRFEGFVDGVPLLRPGGEYDYLDDDGTSGNDGDDDDHACTALIPRLSSSSDQEKASMPVAAGVSGTARVQRPAHFHFLWRTKAYALARFQNVISKQFCAAALDSATATTALSSSLTSSSSSLSGDTADSEDQQHQSGTAPASLLPLLPTTLLPVALLSSTAVLLLCGDSTASAVSIAAEAAAAMKKTVKSYVDKKKTAAAEATTSEKRHHRHEQQNQQQNQHQNQHQQQQQHHHPIRPQEVTREGYLAMGGLLALVKGDVPVVIRATRNKTHPRSSSSSLDNDSSSSPSSSSFSSWSAESMVNRFGHVEGITALVYDQALDGAQPLNTASGLSFQDFAQWAQTPEMFQISIVEPDGGDSDGISSNDVSDDAVQSPPPAQSLAPYLLLTTRHSFEKGKGGATDPNGSLVSNENNGNHDNNHGNNNHKQREEDSFQTLLTQDVPHAFAPDIPLIEHSEGQNNVKNNDGDDVNDKDDWFEAWTSLRLGGRYRYPTHIDCFENMILQLAGNKTVRLLPPRAVGSVRPDPSRKHWPGAPPSELSNWKQENGWWECELTPGDQLFVPLMWFHSVEVTGDSNWSVTANRYFLTASKKLSMKQQQQPGSGDSYFPSQLSSGAGSTAVSSPPWRIHIEGKKHSAWRAYEEATGVGLC